MNPSEIVFSTKRLAKISPELRRAKLDLLADRLEKLAQEKQSIDGKALEDEFRGIGDYSRKKAPNRLQGEGRYSLFSKFIGKNGKLCYQCDGANALLGMIFQDYYRGESGVKVRRIGGVVAINNQLNRGGGHANLALKIGNSRTVFDTTPPTGDESGALTNFRRMLPDLLQLENEGARSEEFKLTPLNAVLKDGSKDGLDGILTKESSIKNMEALRGDFLKFLKSEKYPIHRKHHQWLHPFRILGLYHRFLTEGQSPEEFFKAVEARTEIPVKKYEKSFEGVQKFVENFVSAQKATLKAMGEKSLEKSKKPSLYPGHDPVIVYKNQELIEALDSVRKMSNQSTMKNRGVPLAKPGVFERCGGALKSLGQFLRSG